jgi:hypothetical protein
MTSYKPKKKRTQNESLEKLIRRTLRDTIRWFNIIQYGT